MKFKKALAVLTAAGLLATTAFGLAACGPNEDESQGEVPIGERVKIKALLDGNSSSKNALNKFVAAYNDGQGLDDGVFVSAEIRSGSSSPSSSLFTKSADYAYNVMCINDGQDAFQNLVIKRDAKRAPNGYFVDLTPYAEADEDFKNNNIPESVLNWWRVTYNPNMGQGAGAPKNVIGAGQNLMGVPYGTNPQINLYNATILKKHNINIIHVPEEELEEYNKTNNSKIQPHGYAEYKEAPFTGAKQSKNLLGQDVYKVFNDCIGMNWEEQRIMFKYFDNRWNTEQKGSLADVYTTTEHAFVSEYWFNYGWSVGGDVMGFNGTSYDFTLLDKTPQYLVTKDMKVNGVDYKAGEIVRYEDKVNQANISSVDGLYAIKSMYDAVKEFVSLQLDTNKTVDKVGDVEYKGYAVADPNVVSSINWFNTNKIAFVRTTASGVFTQLSIGNKDDFDICVPETYREYEGGSSYQKDGLEGFENEHLMIIGEKYDLNGDGTVGDDEVYTGALKVVNGTPIVGNSTTASTSQGFIIPSCSDPAKYQASWDFISWAATAGQEYRVDIHSLVPVDTKVLYSDKYLGNTELTRGKNFYAVAHGSENAGRGDWGFFENGSWVTSWANDFNNEVRQGRKILSSFLTTNEEKGVNDLNNMYCVIKGIR